MWAEDPDIGSLRRESSCSERGLYSPFFKLSSSSRGPMERRFR